MPLKLADQTNYAEGFRTPTGFGLVWNTARIYHDYGTLQKTPEGFSLHNERMAKHEEQEFPFISEISAELLEDSAPCSHRKLITQLNLFTQKKVRVKWYIYGKIHWRDSTIVLKPASLDHIICEPYSVIPGA